MNEDIKKMAHLLRTGNSMLNHACPICNNPIFRKSDGLIFCPACNREVIIVDEIQGKNTNITKELILTDNEENKKIDINKNNQQHINDVIEIINQKIYLLNQKMKSETQIDLIDKYSNILLKLFKILSNIRRIQP